MSAKSVRKSEALCLDEATYGALIRFARLRGVKSLSAAARLALRAHLSGASSPDLGARLKPRRIRRLRLQLEPELRTALRASGGDAAQALQSYFFSRSH